MESELPHDFKQKHYFIREKAITAMQHFNKLLKIAQNRGDRLAQSICLGQLGNAYD